MRTGGQMKASVIVLAWNGREYLETCLNAVFAQDYPDFEVIVVDNGSTDGSADFVAERFPQARLIRNERNLGFAAGNNVGLRAATGDVLVLLNQDTQVQPGWLRAMVTALADPTIGIVGCKLLYPDGTIQHAGAYLTDVRGSPEHIGWREPDRGQYNQSLDVEFVTGAALGLTRITLERIGYLDEGFAPVYYEDVDWCYRAREAGLRVVYWPDAVAIHCEGSSTPQMGDYGHRLAYHYGRLRLLLKHKPLDWLEREFTPAEISWVRRIDRMGEVLSARAAYLRAMFALPEILPCRAQVFNGMSAQDGSGEREKILTLLVRLREACAHVEEKSQCALYTQLDHIQEHAVGTRILKAAQLSPLEAEPPPASQPVPEAQELPARVESIGAEVPSEVSEAQELPVQAESTDAEVLSEVSEDLLAALHARWQIKEQPFHSNFPVIGRFIAAFRQAWNNISTRWYVLPMLQQQVEFNAAVVRQITQMAGSQNEIMGQITQLTCIKNEIMGQITQLTCIKNEIAVTQIAILNTLREVLYTQENHTRALAQDVQQEINSVAQAVLDLHKRVDDMERCLKGEDS